MSVPETCDKPNDKFVNMAVKLASLRDFRMRAIVVSLSLTLAIREHTYSVGKR